MSMVAVIRNLLLNGYSFNLFGMEYLGDPCLPSTISNLANKYGLTFICTPEQVLNRFGRETRVVRYLLPSFEHDRAHQVFSMLKKQGRA
jgi:hypothetical protein